MPLPDHPLPPLSSGNDLWSCGARCANARLLPSVPPAWWTAATALTTCAKQPLTPTLLPRPAQAACIPIALAGRDICGSAVTGSGKTAAFALPFLERLLHRPRGLAATYVLVLTPTRELAVQVGTASGTRLRMWEGDVLQVYACIWR